jgi:hypothetical protein
MANGSMSIASQSVPTPRYSWRSSAARNSILGEEAGAGTGRDGGSENGLTPFKAWRAHAAFAGAMQLIADAKRRRRPEV